MEGSGWSAGCHLPPGTRTARLLGPRGVCALLGGATEQAGVVVPLRPLFGETPGDALRLWESPADVPETTGPPLGVSTAVLGLAPLCCDWLTLVNTMTLPDEGQVVGQICPVRVPAPVTLPWPDPFRG